MIFAPIKKNLEKDQEKYEKICEKNAKNGKKGGRPKSEKTQSVFSKPKKTQKSLTQTQTQTQTQKEKTISKEITAPPSSPENFEEKKSFGNPQISQTLEFLKKSVGLDEFKESSRMQRNFGKHFVNLLKKIGRDEFLRRMNEILEDDFRAKNCNSLKYFYGEMKSAIHSPSVIPKSGKTAETTPLCSFDD
jgi:uncharacterized protein (DUF2344 family)